MNWLNKEEYRLLPDNSGVYIFKNAQKKILYIGKATSLKKRVASYFIHTKQLPKTRQMISLIKTISYIETQSEFEALLLEAFLIHTHKPKYNLVLKDDKHPLYIKITKEKYPHIYTVRKEPHIRAYYFGPFPSSGIVRETLKNIRDIIPFCIEKHMRKTPCFYSHIGLCNPCPNTIALLPVKEQNKQLAVYKTNIRMIRHLLEGKSNQVLTTFNKTMKEYSNQNEFEKAQIVKQQRDKLLYLTARRMPVMEYVKNPNLLEDIGQQELTSLQKLLSINTPIRRIEGYDISHTQGTSTTGSMVVFIDSQKSTRDYRHFKIKNFKHPDDIASMHQLLSRRLNHREWELPDVILVDGGKGQVHVAYEVLRSVSLSIPVIGLAKKEEEIIIPHARGTNLTFVQKRLPKSHHALHVLQRIRDESHRFSRRLHFKLRSARMLYS